MYKNTYSLHNARQLRTRIRRNVNLVRDLVAETHCLKLMPTNCQSNKGIVVRDCAPFNSILNTPYFKVSFLPKIINTIDRFIAVLHILTNIESLQN